MKFKSANFLAIILSLTIVSCNSDSGTESPFTGNQISFELIPGEIEGITTTGTLVLKERNDGKGEIEITLNGVLSGAEHPVHLHFGSLDGDGLVATYLTQVTEVNGVGKSNTILESLDDGTALTYSDLVTFNGSVKIHFEETGALKDVVLGATNIGMNIAGNEAYLLGDKDITTCNSDFQRN